MTGLSITDPLDMHLHLREGQMLQTVTPLSARDFAAGVVMPNLQQPVDTLAHVLKYQNEIKKAASSHSFTPLMTLFFREYSEDELLEAKPHIFGIKLYPAGITTQSESGVSDIRGAYETIELLEDLDIPLLVHGESNGFVMDREREFLALYGQIAADFPRLHLVMEHITTADAVRFLDRFDNVSATITLHHLLITLDDVAGGLLEPDLFCKPIAKTPKDREALRQAVLTGHPKVMFGSDSAPHPRHKKECCGCAAGIFSAPVALPLLAQMFEEEDRLDKLQGFVSDIAQKRYRLPSFGKTVRLIQREWLVPEHYDSVKPFYGGQSLRWAVER